MQSWRRPIIGLLIVVTVLLLYGAHYWGQLTRQNRAMTHLHNLGGEVITGVTYTNWTPTWLPRSRYLSIGTEVMTVSLDNSRLDNVDLDLLKDLPHMKNLKLSNESVNDQVLLTLPHLDSLQALFLNGTEISAEGLQHVLTMAPDLDFLILHGSKLQDKDLAVLKIQPKLKAIVLSKTQITDAGLKHLLGLPELEHLNLGDTSITPAGLELLQKLPRLRTLSLRGIEVNVDDVQFFVGMKNLDFLNLEEGQLTSEILQNFKSEMPQLKVLPLKPK